MTAAITTPATPTPTQQQAVPAASASTTYRSFEREYASSRAFHRDAAALYARTGYTVSDTAGMPRRSLIGFLWSFWPHQEHIVITYQSPTNSWRGDHAAH